MQKDATELIRIGRVLIGLSQGKAALEAGMSPSTWCAIERGYRSLTDDKLHRMARVLGLDAAMLRTLRDEPAQSSRRLPETDPSVNRPREEKP